YGPRMVEMARLIGIAHHAYDRGEIARPDVQGIDAILNADPTNSHIAMLHSETTTGLLNPIDEVGPLAHRYGTTYIVDARSS
ncbi:2-aminoethylphosphonate--pyruvate transaminase, partial [Salmonella enterica subsp. enterica serovar Enteritidis]